MNINIDNLQAEEFRLQQLANYLFGQSRASVGTSPSGIRLPDTGNVVNMKAPQTALPDPHFPSGGSGATDLAKLSTLSQLPIFDYMQYHQDYYFLKDRPVAQLPEMGNFPVDVLRKEFPILQEYVNGRPLVWLDNAATTQKPSCVIERISQFYRKENSNIHRAAHQLAARATDAYESARESVRSFINAGSSNEIVFVRGTTEGINLVAYTLGAGYLKSGDQVLISNLEHHANIVPWQQLRERIGIELVVIPVDDSGQIDMEAYKNLLTSKVKLVSFVQVSNALGTITPAKKMIQWAHAAGAKVLLDGAQSVSHMPIDLQELKPDFFVFSGHKVFGPTGIGVLYIQNDTLDELPAWQGGGNMIRDVRFDNTTYQNGHARFEAGTGNIADAVGLGAALEFLRTIGMHSIAAYEHQLLLYATEKLKQVPGLEIIGKAADKASVLSFTLADFSNESVGKHLDEHGIAVRTGHHCAQPILRRFGQETTVRPSLAFYNTKEEIDWLQDALFKLISQR
ncbi:cysteine desulfurase [Flavihumibacter sp. CACIAM 22H1]|uniref:cysteine desulfurase n=1 Tax=Flavihumibacter sp. CACIAM 22H1 TaxID=1812911 RepID=UPI0007A7E62A|nr:cysteine desulfurase [Flavihumibacter sp. CACIAM 22H1]KYP15485.1 MAG: hypothetical protein A1D16_08300 [Flavihumibacter sp. CACIAM 22H1]